MRRYAPRDAPTVVVASVSTKSIPNRSYSACPICSTPSVGSTGAEYINMAKINVSNDDGLTDGHGQDDENRSENGATTYIEIERLARVPLSTLSVLDEELSTVSTFR